MYEHVFQFNSRPFTSTPFVKHYFSGDAIHQALGQAKLCIDRASGPVMVVGGAGTGKSLLLAMLENQYHSQFNVVNLACGQLDQRKDLLQNVLFGLNQPYQGMTDAELRFALMEFLNPSEQCPHGLLLLIDEAHLLSREMLDEVRLITNFVRDGEPRVRLVMAGNQRLEENLSEPKLDSFNQRIAARCYLTNMTREETAEYVVEHVERAGGGDLFDPDSLKAVHEVSDGCPRLVNQVCDHALILAATRGESVIHEQCVREAWSDIQSIPGDWAAPATQPESASKLEEDESWTVIEFGQLDDSDQQPGQATVEVLENSQPIAGAEQAVAGDDLEEQTDSGESETFEHGAEVFQHETGSDEIESTERQLADLNAEAEGQLSDSQPVVSVAKGENQPYRTADDGIDHSISDMEAQLNAVFGQGLESTEPAQEKDIAELEAEQEALLDQVESAKRDTNPVDSVDAVDDSSSATEQLAVAIAAFTDDQVAADAEADNSACVESESDIAADTDWIESEHQPSPSAGDQPVSMASETPETPPVASTAGDSGHADTEPDPVLSTDVLNSQEADSPAELLVEPQALEESIEEEQVYETDDPFAEDFAEEEHLVDRYAPFVAHQNQSSLSLTSSDLAMIRPLDAEVDPTSADPQEPVNEDIQTVGPPSQAPEPNAPTIDIVQADNGDSEHTVAGESFETEADASTADQAWAESDQSQEVETSAENSLADLSAQTLVNEPAGDSTPQPEQDLSNADFEAAVQAASQFADAQTQPVESEPVESEPVESEPVESEPVENKSMIDDPSSSTSSAEIERQAEEILHRLGISQDVSCETETPDYVDSDDIDSQTPAESEGSVTPHEIGRDAQITVPLVSQSEPTVVFDHESSGTTEYERQNAALDETQQILNEILEQKNLLANQRVDSESLETDANPSPAYDEPPVSTEPECSTSADDATQPQPPMDDREMIIVNKMEEPAETPSPKQPPTPHSSDQVSKGRAKRMDYQKLFDQLRDISNSKQ